MRVTVIDNYDSFTFNLVQALMVLEARVTVYRNDERTVDEILAQRPDRLMISPGPGGPREAGISQELIERAAAGRVALLGVCLGHQCLAEVFGGRVVRVAPVHGKTSGMHHDGVGLFAGLDQGFEAARYHSLAVDPETLPEELAVTARTIDGVIMGLHHRQLPLAGVQFHPESFMTPAGPSVLANFLAPAFARVTSGDSEVSEDSEVFEVSATVLDRRLRHEEPAA
jgi:anthranilate synthase/aminodeoxychorismate synthase-like glutamine amidotransferase